MITYVRIEDMIFTFIQILTFICFYWT